MLNSFYPVILSNNIEVTGNFYKKNILILKKHLSAIGISV